jgi:uncharacterized UBP type Zn finger protein
MAECSHLEKVSTLNRDPIEPSGPGCQECLATGGYWEHLRLCMECGHVGCCDSSPNKHATAHYHKTKHPVIKSFEPNESWVWCYRDEVMRGAIPSFPEESPPQHLSSPQI